jgi:hypothetical protein
VNNGILTVIDSGATSEDGLGFGSQEGITWSGKWEIMCDTLLHDHQGATSVEVSSLHDQ